jgi:hypothetical protein
VISARKQPQALRRLVEQFCLGQNTPTDCHHRVRGEDVRSSQLIIQVHVRQGRRCLSLGQSRSVGTRDLAALGSFIEIGRLEGVRLDSGLIDQGKAARRTGSEHEFGTADHVARQR